MTIEEKEIIQKNQEKSTEDKKKLDEKAKQLDKIRINKISEIDDPMYDDGDDYDDYDESEDDYDRDGYDEDIYDRDGYDEDIYNRDGIHRGTDIKFDHNGYDQDRYDGFYIIDIESI